MNRFAGVAARFLAGTIAIAGASCAFASNSDATVHSAESPAHDASDNAADWVLITGASRGIGFQLASDLSKSGRNVIVACRTQEKASLTAERLLQAAKSGSGSIASISIDVASKQSILSAVQHLREHYDQQLDAVVNNAGVNTCRWSQQAWDLEFATNSDGPIMLAEQLASVLREGGRIVNVSSSLGQLEPQGSEYGGIPSGKYRTLVSGATTLQQLRRIGFDSNDAAMQQQLRRDYPVPAYMLSKALLNKATQLLATNPELLRRNISVCAVCPGSCESDMNPILFTRTTAQGAASIAWCVAHRHPEQLSGKFWRDGRQLQF